MKKLVLVLLAFTAFLNVEAQDKIMVIADPHVLPQSVIDQEENFDEYMTKQRKMVDLSEPVWHALEDTALLHRPSLILIPGDLTRDGEQAAHDTVSATLMRLQNAGIRTLVIPGNHDLPGNDWATLYPGTFANAAKDPDSWSFAVSPLSGVTVIGIDGSDGNAGIGKLSEATQAWILSQADSATAKGHTIIAMSHWQILEHFDQQGTLESSCRFKDADDLRDSLMAHGVHLVLTGHFHVNGITTFRDTTGLTNDSLVEITTGSPITYPCPYRWLTLSSDRSEISVETDFITALDTIADLNTYSRDWMREHTQNLIPALALRAWGKVENKWDRVEEILASVYLSYLADEIKSRLPKTDSAKIDIVQRHIGPAAIELYLFHSEANENERPEVGQALADSIYAGMEGMMDEVLDVYAFLFKGMAKAMAQEPVQSMVEDVTQWLSNYPDQTDDLHPTLILNAPQDIQSVEEQILDDHTPTARKVLINGHLVIENPGGRYSILGEKW